MKNKICWVDLEVTSFDKKHGALTQISMVIESDNEIVDSIDLRINPFTYDRNIEVKPYNLARSGRTLQQIKQYPNSKDQFQKMLEFLRKHSTQELILGGHNIIQHDVFYMKDWFKMHYVNMYDFFSYKYLDTLVLARFLDSWGLLEGCADSKLGSLTQHFNIRLDQWHNSKHDVRATFELHQSIKQLLLQNPTK